MEMQGQNQKIFQAKVSDEISIFCPRRNAGVKCPTLMSPA